MGNRTFSVEISLVSPFDRLLLLERKPDDPLYKILLGLSV